VTPVTSSNKVRAVGFLVGLFGVVFVVIGLDVLVFATNDLSTATHLIFGVVPLVLGALALYSGLSVMKRGRL
jgi:hypothetical protein